MNISSEEYPLKPPVKEVLQQDLSMKGEDVAHFAFSNELKNAFIVSSIHNSIFGNKRDNCIDLSDLDNVSKINNDMIKKLNYEYEQLASRSKSLTQKSNGRKVLYAKTRKSS